MEAQLWCECGGVDGEYTDGSKSEVETTEVVCLYAAQGKAVDPETTQVQEALQLLVRKPTTKRPQVRKLKCVLRYKRRCRAKVPGW